RPDLILQPGPAAQIGADRLPDADQSDISTLQTSGHFNFTATLCVAGVHSISKCDRPQWLGAFYLE
ncbi:hypothetical protein, partial [Rhizobium phaseoli]|uniref:hypothetical protein n=1 Tax=Rhizobium phaseoli TaxID=396 RepID=UPI0019D19549